MPQFFCDEVRPAVVPLNIVYLATNSINGKRYIGMTTKGLQKRILGHIARSTSTKNIPYFSRAIKKYGIDAFHFSILEECPDQDTASQREREMIAERRPEYNTSAGGLTGPQGWKHSEETRRKMSGRLPPWAGKNRSPETVARMSDARRALGFAPMLGKRHSAETIAKMRVSAIGRIRRSVRCLDDGKEFANLKEAARAYNVSYNSFRRWCNVGAEPISGLSFEYAEAAQ